MQSPDNNELLLCCRQARAKSAKSAAHLVDLIVAGISSINASEAQMKIAYALAFVGLLAILSPVADARRLLQSSSVTDADILNFALNLEVIFVAFVLLCLLRYHLSEFDC